MVFFVYCSVILYTLFQVPKGQTWVEKPDNKTVTIGSNVHIPCETNGTGQTNIIWNKDTIPIFVNGQRGGATPNRYTIGGNNTLIIHNVNVADAAFYTCTIFGFESAKMYLEVTGGSLNCLSCSDVNNSSSCNHSISCQSDEVCYTHHYVTDSGRNKFDFGCSKTGLCSTSAKRHLINRSEGRHNICFSCCNNTNHCNNQSHCELHYKDSNRSCLSCTDILPDSTCRKQITCKKDEVCFTHRFLTESGEEKYDLGCSNSKSCVGTSTNQFIGKRSDGRHSRCYTCCNDTDSCNRQTSCNNNYEGAKYFIPECSTDRRITQTGIYTIFPLKLSTKPVNVLCKREADGTIWTVIQRRIDGSLNFTRNWESYKNGFGNASGEYWIGNEVLHALTNKSHHLLRVVMTDFDGNNRWAQYGEFRVNGEDDSYRLNVANYTGNAGDELSYSNSQQFSTPDRDNDQADDQADDTYDGDCANYFSSGWWFNNCYYCNLNGVYRRNGNSVSWERFSSALKTATMMLRKIS